MADLVKVGQNKPLEEARMLALCASDNPFEVRHPHSGETLTVTVVERKQDYAILEGDGEKFGFVINEKEGY